MGPDLPSQFSDAATTTGKWGAFALFLAGLARVLISAARRLGATDGLIDAQGKYREDLHKDMDALRVRLAEAEAARERAQVETIEWRKRVVELEAEVERLKEQIGRLMGAWDPERTLPPGLR